MKAIIVYGTCSGNTELVSDAVAEGLMESEIETVTVRGEQARAESLASYDLIILACATWNVGQLQEYYVPFYKEFCKLSLSGKAMAVIGLGDSKHYDIFCGAADLLEAAVSKVGAQQILPTLRIDGLPHAHLEEYKRWGAELAKTFVGKHLPSLSQTA